MPFTLLRWWYVTCWLSLWMYHYSIGQGAIISRPVSQVVLPGQRSVVFRCTVTDFGIWFVNGSGLYDTNADAFQRRGITYDISEVQSASGKTVTNLSLVVENRPENNATYIQCYSYGSDVETSPYAWMIVAGPPLAPSPVVQILSMTYIALVWDKPFTWTEVADIEYYTVLMFNDTSQVWTNRTHVSVGSATRQTHYLSIPYVAKQCQPLTFMVSAKNSVGSSGYGSVNGGFPIQIQWPEISNGTSRLSTSIQYTTNGTIFVNCTVQPPVMCGYQQASFSVIVSNYRSGSVVARATTQTYLHGNFVTIPLSFKPQTSENTDYNVILDVSSFGTELQAVTSFNVSPTLMPKDSGKKDFNIALVAGVASGSLSVVVLIASIVTFCIARKQIKAKGDQPNSEPDYEQAPPLPPPIEHLYDHIPDFQKSSMSLNLKFDLLESEWQLLNSGSNFGTAHHPLPIVTVPPRVPETVPCSDNRSAMDNLVGEYVEMGAILESQYSQDCKLTSCGRSHEEGCGPDHNANSSGSAAISCGPLSTL